MILLMYDFLEWEECAGWCLPEDSYISILWGKKPSILNLLILMLKMIHKFKFQNSESLLHDF